MYLMVESMIRGGITSVGEVRKCSANNKYLKN